MSLSDVLDTTELVKDSVVSKMEITVEEGITDSINKFLEFNEYKTLEGYGKIPRQQAEQKAFAKYEKFNKTQRIESDFDKEIKAFLKAQENKEAGDKNDS